MVDQKAPMHTQAQAESLPFLPGISEKVPAIGAWATVCHVSAPLYHGISACASQSDPQHAMPLHAAETPT
jgi:hypothetical protein